MTTSKNSRPAENPCVQLVDVWVNNVFPDIALQVIGTKLLAEAFALSPRLMDAETYKDLPGVSRDKWTPETIEPEKCTMHAAAFAMPLDVVVDENKLRHAAEAIARQLNSAADALEGIVRGTVRINLRSGSVAGLLTAELMWMGVKR